MEKDFKVEQVSLRLHHDRFLYSEKPLSNALDVAQFLQEEFCDYDREHFVVINMNSQLQPINLNIVSVGTLTSSLVDPSQVFKSGILSNASCMMLAHNHPSGVATSSNEDILATKRLIAASSIIGIKILDHVVVGKNNYYSFESKGLISEFYDEFYNDFTSNYLREKTIEYNSDLGVENKSEEKYSVQANRNRIENIFDTNDCYGDVFVEISNADFSYLTELYCDKPEEFKELVPRIQWLSISNNDEFKYQCCDNRQGEAFQESFDDINKAIRWFEGESIDDIEMDVLEEDDEELCQ